MGNIYLNDFTLARGNKQQTTKFIHLYIRTVNGNWEISIHIRTINRNVEKTIATNLPPNGMMTTLCLQHRAVIFTTSSWHSAKQNQQIIKSSVVIIMTWLSL